MLKVREHVNGQEAARDHRSTEVVAKPSRRRFKQAYFDAVLKELDEAKHVQKGKILQREGLYTKQVDRWSAERAGACQRSGAASRQREIARLRRKLEQTEIIMDVQKRVAVLLDAQDTSEESR
jgi:transposase